MRTRTARTARPALVAAAAVVLIASGAGTTYALTAEPGSATPAGGSTSGGPAADLLAGSYRADHGRLSVEEPKGRVRNKVEPSLQGAPTVGRRLTVDPGTWKPAPDAVAFQWYLDGDAISGATEDRYTPRPADHGSVLSVVVIAAKEGYRDGTAVSDAATVAPAPLDLVVRPVLKGRAEVGETLRTTDGTWSAHGASATYQWYRDGEKVRGATGRTYDLRRGDLGSRLVAKVTVTKAGYQRGQATTARSDKVVKG